MRKASVLVSVVVAALVAVFNVSPAFALAPSAVIDSGGWSAGLAHDDRYIYNSLLAQSQVIRIDPASNQIVDTFTLPAGSQPYEMTIVDGYLYTANFWNMSNTAPGTISRINLATGEVVGAWATLSNGFKAEWITSNSTEIFVSGGGGSGNIARIPINDPSSVTQLTSPYAWTSDIVVSGNYLYIAGASNTQGGVIRVNLTDNTIDPQWALAGTKIIGIAISGDNLFVGKFASNTVAKIRTSDGQVLATSTAITSFPWLMNVSGGVIYVSQLNGDVSTVDANDLTVLGNPYVTPLAGNMVYDSLAFKGSLWVSSYQPNDKVYRYDLVNVPTVTPATQAPANAVVGQPFSTSPLTATNFMTEVSYSIYPDLPAGLTLNPSTGEISGTPLEESAVTTYTIRATGTDFETVTVTFGVDASGSSGPVLPNTGVNSGVGAASAAMATLLALTGIAALVVVRRKRVVSAKK